MTPANQREYERLTARLRAIIDAAERAGFGDFADLRLSWSKDGACKGAWRVNPDLLERGA